MQECIYVPTVVLVTMSTDKKGAYFQEDNYGYRYSGIPLNGHPSSL